MLRKNVKCFGEDSCFSLAFGVPGILMVVATVIFVCGKPLYRIKNPKGYVILRTAQCITHAFSNKLKMRKDTKKEHWMDYADDKYDRQLIMDIKATLKVLWLYMPLPLYWSLFDQQGSGWTLMATRMRGELGFYTILPDQMQVVNPVLILLFIPIFEVTVYPLFAKCNLLVRPLQRMVTGGYITALAFFVSAIIQARIEKTEPYLPVANEAQVRFYNMLPCSVYVTGLSAQGKNVDAMSFYVKNHLETDTQQYQVKFEPKNCEGINDTRVEHSIQLKSASMHGLVIRTKGASINVADYEDSVEKSNSGHPRVR